MPEGRLMEGRITKIWADWTCVVDIGCLVNTRLSSKLYTQRNRVQVGRKVLIRIPTDRVWIPIEIIELL